MLLITDYTVVCFSRILKYRAILLNILVRVRHDSVNFCIHINECLYTENMYLV